MTALSAERDTRKWVGEETQNYPVKDTYKIYKGGLVMLDAGYARPGATAVGKICVGRCKTTVDNGSSVTGHADGFVRVDVEKGVFWFANGDSIAQADVGKDCYITDDATVAKANLGTKSKAGIIMDVDSTLGVAVKVGIEEQEINAGPLVQYGTGVLTLGVLTVATGVTITATSAIVASIKTPAGVFSDGGLDIPSADRVVGGPGVGTFVIRALVQAGTANTSDTSTVDYIIVG